MVLCTGCTKAVPSAATLECRRFISFTEHAHHTLTQREQSQQEPVHAENEQHEGEEHDAELEGESSTLAPTMTGAQRGGARTTRTSSSDAAQRRECQNSTQS